MVVDPEWTRILDDVRMSLPGVIDSVLKHKLYMVVDRFLDESNVWRESVVFDTVADVTEYDVEPDENTAYVARLLSLEGSVGQSISATMAEPAVIILRNATSTVEEYTATFALRLRATDTVNDLPVIPQWLLRKYRDAFVAGLMAAMQMQQAKPYSNERQAVLNERRFMAAISVARNEANRTNLHGAQRWHYPGF